MRLVPSIPSAILLLSAGSNAFVPASPLAIASSSPSVVTAPAAAAAASNKHKLSGGRGIAPAVSLSMGLSDDDTITCIANMNLPHEIGISDLSKLLLVSADASTIPTEEVGTSTVAASNSIVGQTTAALSLSLDLPRDPLILPDIDLNLPMPALSLGSDGGSLSIPPEVSEAINDFVAWAKPQIEALADYVAADLSNYWDQYVALLEARDSATIIGTGWGGLIFVLIVANTLARGRSEEKRLAAFEAAQAAKEEAEAKAAARKARVGGGAGGLFGKPAGSSGGGGGGGPSRLQKRLDRQAAIDKRRAEIEKKKRAARLEAKAKANRAAFDKKQKEKKKKEAARKRILKADFQKRKGLGKNKNRK